MSPITSHVLDLARGRPAAKLPLRLDVLDAQGGWSTLAERATDEDGRVSDLLPPGELPRGTYRISFDTQNYLEATGQPVFYPWVEIIFRIEQPAEHYHIPLLLSPYGYSTYRGS